MSGKAHAFRLPKAGNADADYEDAFAIGENCVAIADGATESSFARAWAEALVQGFTSIDATPTEARPGPVSTSSEQVPTVEIADNEATLQAVDGEDYRQAGSDLTAIAMEVRRKVGPLQKAWHASIAWDRLPWFAEDKARSGAFAALLAFHIDSVDGSGTDEARSARGTQRWRAMAIGDSCVFQVRDSALHVAFPIDRAEQFNSRPVLLSSNPANNERVWDAIAVQEGDCLPGDIFLFATDALSHWILGEVEAGRRPWETLCDLRSHAAFVELMTRLRESHTMRNDDVTLVRFVMPADSEWPHETKPDSQSDTPLEVEESAESKLPLPCERSERIREAGTRVRVWGGRSFNLAIDPETDSQE